MFGEKKQDDLLELLYTEKEEDFYTYDDDDIVSSIKKESFIETFIKYYLCFCCV